MSRDEAVQYAPIPRLWSWLLGTYYVFIHTTYTCTKNAVTLSFSNLIYVYLNSAISGYVMFDCYYICNYNAVKLAVSKDLIQLTFQLVHCALYSTQFTIW